jgi:hypothetical protein
MAERFEFAVSVSIRCEWHGLAWRQIFDPNAIWHQRERASDDRRIATGNWPITALAGDWPRIVSHLAAPVMRAFTTDFVVTPQWVQGQTGRWLR